MADEFNSSTNWWDSSNSSRNRFKSGSNNNNPSSSSSSGLNNTLGSFSWPTAELMVDHVKPRSSLDHQSSNSESSVLQPHDSSNPAADLHLMGLGLSSQAIDHWNQSLFRGSGEKSDGSTFRSIENLNSSSCNYQQESGNINIGSSSSPSSQVHQWRERVLGFSLDHQQFSPHGSSTDSTVTCQGLHSGNNFQQMDNSPSIYACGSPATLLQGLVLSTGSPSDQQNQTQQAYTPYMQNYDQFLPPSSSSSWSKVPNKQPPHQLPHSHLHFSNNAPFWNASASSNMNDVRPSYFQPLQPQFPASSFDEKPKQNISEVRDSNTVVKKSGTEGGGGGGGGGAAASTAKRPRNETPSTLPAFKVRKEKMGDRITALQQLVSPFGKTDTASVLSEAIEYIKFLHEQVSVLSTPYMKSGAAIHHHHQSSDHKSKDAEGQKQDLRSQGLCLVPVSSTFPVTHETTMDIWTPTYGGTYR